MEKNSEKITMSSELKDQLGLEAGNEVSLKMHKKELLLEQNFKLNDGLPFKYFIYPTIVATIVFLITVIFFDNRVQIPLNGTDSLASFVLVLGGLSGTITFIVFLFYNKIKKNGTLSVVYWRNFPAIIISILLMMLVLFIWLFWVLDILFYKVSFDIFTSTILFFVLVAILNYILIYVATSFDSKMMTRLFFFFITAGTFYAMINNKNEYWWKENFSFLGTSGAINSWQFNLTLILTSALMIAMIDYLFVLLKKKYKDDYKKFFMLKVLLVTMALILAGVGLVPNEEGIMHTIHDLIANSLIVFFIITIIFIKWLLPYQSREFVLTSYAVGIFLLVIYLLFSVVNYLSLTGFELIAFIISFVWLIKLFNHLEKLTKDDKEAEFINVIIE